MSTNRIVHQRPPRPGYGLVQQAPLPSPVQSVVDGIELNSEMQRYADISGEGADSTRIDAAIRSAKGDLGRAAESLDAQGYEQEARQLHARRNRVDDAVNKMGGDFSGAANALERRGHSDDAELLRRRLRSERAAATLNTIAPLSEQWNDQGVPTFDRRILTEGFQQAGLEDLLPHILTAADVAEKQALEQSKRNKADAEERERRGYAPLAFPTAIPFPRLSIDWWNDDLSRGQ